MHYDSVNATNFEGFLYYSTLQETVVPTSASEGARNPGSEEALSTLNVPFV